MSTGDRRLSKADVVNDRLIGDFSAFLNPLFLGMGCGILTLNRGEHEIVYVVARLLFHQSRAGCTQGRQVRCFFRQVKSHRDCHRQRPQSLSARHTVMQHRSLPASIVSGSGRYVEYGTVAGAHRPQISDLTLKKMLPDGLSTYKQLWCSP
jgi:hypothetical protein